MKLPLLHLWRDTAFRSAAENMALDEAVFRWALSNGEAAARFYTWDRPARTRGYFQRDTAESEDIEDEAPIRRYTGGGLVEHGEDLTFALALPAGSAPASLDAVERYRWIHEALAAALAAASCSLSLAGAVSGAGRGRCFANPVPWDLVDPASGTKVAGGAQRRTRGAVIHQGSVRLPHPLRQPGSAWVSDFVSALSARTVGLDEEARRLIGREAEALEESRYRTRSWNRHPAASLK